MLKLICFCLVYFECAVNDRASTFHVTNCERRAGSPVQSVFQECELRVNVLLTPVPSA